MGPQSRESPKFGNFGTPIWESWDKMPFDVGLMERQKVRGEGGGFPQVQAVVSVVSPSLPVVRPSTKSAQTMH